MSVTGVCVCVCPHVRVCVCWDVGGGEDLYILVLDPAQNNGFLWLLGGGRGQTESRIHFGNSNVTTYLRYMGRKKNLEPGEEKSQLMTDIKSHWTKPHPSTQVFHAYHWEQIYSS